MDHKLTQLTRRRVSLMLGGWLAVPASAQSTQTGLTIHQEVDFQTTPGRIYQALLDAKQFSAFTQARAEIDARPGGAFTLFGGLIEGRNVELVTDQMIVQAWRPASGAAGVYSIVRFELVVRAGGTRIVFDHAGFTDEERGRLLAGWSTHYWEPLHKYLAG
jgi:activator of HSP90 ATPase